MNSDDKVIGEKLKRFRVEKGLSLAQAAGQINVSPAFISMVENGKTGISFRRMHELVTLYGKNLADLTETENEDATVINIRSAPVVAKEGGVTIYGLAKMGGALQLGGFRICFDPGAEHNFDHHRGYEYAFIIEGDFTLRLNELDGTVLEAREMHEGDTTIYPASVLHSWKNTGEVFGSIFLSEIQLNTERHSP